MAFNNGMEVYISPTPVGDDHLTQNEFEAIDDWEQILNVGEVPDDRGPESDELTYQTMKEVIKGTGSINWGGGNLVYNNKGENAGRDAIEGLIGSKFNYAMKFVHPDSTGEDPGHMSPTIEYVRTLVRGNRFTGGGQDAALNGRVALSFNQWMKVPSAVIPNP